MKSFILTLSILSLLMGNFSHLIAQRYRSPISNITIYAGLELGIISATTIRLEKYTWSNRFDNVYIYSWAGLGVGIWNYDTGGPGIEGGLSLLTGERNHHFEFDLGVFLGLDDLSGLPRKYIMIFPKPSIGYRYQNPKGGLLLRAYIGIGLGASVGYAF